jgi:hypothetical protein
MPRAVSGSDGNLAPAGTAGWRLPIQPQGRPPLIYPSMPRPVPSCLANIDETHRTELGPEARVAVPDDVHDRVRLTRGVPRAASAASSATASSWAGTLAWLALAAAFSMNRAHLPLRVGRAARPHYGLGGLIPYQRFSRSPMPKVQTIIIGCASWRPITAPGS